MKRVAFLLGSGISRDSGALMVNEISNKLLNQGWCNEGEFRFSPSSAESAGSAKRAQEFLCFLKSYIEPHLHLREKRNCHYEDLYAAALQIFQDEISELVNPMLRGSVSEIQSSVENLYQDQEAGIYPNAFARLVHSGTLLIRWGVFHLLRPVEKPVGMGVLTAVAQATQEMDIFTVNHDLLIERQLQQSGILFSDGFTEEDGDVLRFDSSWKNEAAVRLYKLHGSIDWYKFHFSDDAEQFAKVPRALNPRGCKDRDDQDLDLLDPTPFLLIGTTGKERLYNVGIVSEFSAKFRARIENYHTLICCGYGWSDKGINNRINQWVQGTQNNRIVILHKNSVDELKQKPFWKKMSDRSGSRWEYLERDGKLVVVRKWLSECVLNDLEPFFDH